MQIDKNNSQGGRKTYAYLNYVHRNLPLNEINRLPYLYFNIYTKYTYRSGVEYQQSQHIFE